jgi:hypothetical protein
MVGLVVVSSFLGYVAMGLHANAILLGCCGGPIFFWHWFMAFCVTVLCFYWLVVWF